MRWLLLFIYYGLTISLVNADSGTLKIDWSELNKQQKSVSARRSPYPEVLTNGVAQTKLPVYLPASHAYDQNMSVVANKDFYSITLSLGHASLVVAGDRSFQQSMPQNSEAQALLQATKNVQFVRAEGMMTSSFNRYGANYSLTLECTKPDEDKRCLRAGFLKNLYQELVLVGGHP